MFLPLGLLALIRRIAGQFVPGFLAVGAVFLWTVPNIVQFQAWDFDTNKFFSYAILISLAAVAVTAEALGGFAKRAATFALILAVLTAVPTSLIASWRILPGRNEENRVSMLSAPEREIAGWLTAHTQDNASILSSAFLAGRTFVQNPIVIASGRRTTIGDTAWLYTHGIDFVDRLESVKAFLSDPAGHKGLLREIHTDYLVVDGLLRRHFAGLEANLAEGGYALERQEGEFAVYRLRD